VTAPAIVVRGATIALCRRTNLRKAFLAPWHEEVAGIWLYALAVAQRNTKVAIHQTTLVLNHHHTEVTPTEANLPDFKRLVHGESSKALNALMARERYDQPRQVWDDRATHAMRLLDAEAQGAHMIYGHVNAVAAGLVRTPSEMPGWTFDFGMWKSGTIMVRRPTVYFDPDVYAEWLPLTFTPSPELYRAFGGDLDALVHHMRKLSEDAVRALREVRKGRPMIGAAALRRIHPWNEPRTMREPGGGRVPTFKHGARGLTAKVWDIAGALDTKRFRGEHYEARLERLAGEPAAFPYGTYLMRVQHGAEVAKPHEDALVTAPGMTLDEVKEELAKEGGARARELELDPIRDAFRDEAGDIVAVEDVELVAALVTTSSAAKPSSDDAKTEKARPGPQARHGFTPGTSDERAGEGGASRVVVLRDLRRGRPPKKSTDPPA
jgi:hypothetical protein